MRKDFGFLIILCLLIAVAATHSTAEESKMQFWDRQQKGANIFNEEILRKDIKAAKNYGITFIRLAPDKFISEARDFLIGDADDYQGLVPEDLRQLKGILDMFYEEEMPVLITVLSLPGSRWRQNNKGVDDLRIWRNREFQNQAAKFWQDLSGEIAGHPTLVGFNVLNEPHPERLFSQDDMTEAEKNEVRNMLFEFYDLVIASIRKVDKDIPIILDSSAYADPNAFQKMRRHNDKRVLYSFHMYEPYAYTNKRLNDGKFKYPGLVNGVYWDYNALKNYMNAVVAFQRLNNISNNRILVGEFGGHRMSEGLSKYFADLTGIFNENGWHYAFYAFREDTWDGMDYELGSGGMPWSYWQALERGEKTVVDRNPDSPIFKSILDSIQKP